jgi:peptidoglycan L-alanyl-D-glutamate endopeptidase CwlK
VTLAVAFRLGAASEGNLVGIDGGLVSCARRAILTTLQDFGVFEGLRSITRQTALVAAGASRTMDSYHLPDSRGTGHALDLVPFVAGRLQWQLPLCLMVAVAMRAASDLLDVPLVWGGVWDRTLTDLDPANLGHEIALYTARYQATHPPVMVAGKLTMRYPLVDGPHFQTLTR